MILSVPHKLPEPELPITLTTTTSLQQTAKNFDCEKQQSSQRPAVATIQPPKAPINQPTTDTATCCLLYYC